MNTRESGWGRRRVPSPSPATTSRNLLGELMAERRRRSGTEKQEKTPDSTDVCEQLV